MNLNRIKIGILLAALLGLAVFAIPALGACPAGTYNLFPVQTNPVPAWNPYDGTIVTEVGNTATITQPGTYCVPCTGVTLGAAGNVIDTVSVLHRVDEVVVASSNVTIIGECPSGTVTGPGGTNIFTVNAGLTGVSFQNFTITQAATDTAGITTASTVVQGMTFNVGNGGPGVIVTAGTASEILNNTFNYTAAGNVRPAILLQGGSGHTISNNTVNGGGVAAGAQDGITINTVIQVGLTVQNNSFLNMGGDGIDATGLGVTNANITGNTCNNPQLKGFDLGTATNSVVANNTFTGIAQGAGADEAILDAAGSNNEYKDNTITSTTSTGRAINVTSSSSTISGNSITWSAAAGLNGIDANGSNTKILNNTIHSARTDAINAAATSNEIKGNTVNFAGGWGINLSALAASNSVVDNNTISNAQGGGLQDISSGNTQITNNTLNNTSGNHAISVNTNPTNDTITGNTIDGVSGAGLDGINVAVGTNHKINNNTIKNVHGGQAISLGGAQNNSEIIGNTIDPIARDGILLNGDDNVQIKNNTIKKAATTATSTNPFAAIRLAVAASTNCTIDGNKIEDTGSNTYCVGIAVTFGGCDNNVISNNEITQAGVGTTVGATSNGILVTNGNNNTVSNNNVHNTGNMKDGIVVNTVNRIAVTGNTIEGMTGRGLVLAGGTANNPVDVQANILTNNVTGISMQAGNANVTNVNKVSGGATALRVTTTTNAANFKVNGNCIDSPILANNEGFGTLDATGNYWASIPGPTNVFGPVDTSGALASCPGEPTPPPSKTHTYGAAAGWYMVSVSLNSGTPSALFGTVAYHWNCATGVYDTPGTIEPQFGYWASLPANKVVNDTGDEVTTDVTISISCTGWHQVSAPWSYPKSAIKVTKGGVEKSWADAVTAGWVRDTIYAYKATDGDYTMPTTLNPWYGHWVRANVSGLSLKLLYASGTPVSASFAPMGPKALVVPADLPPMPPSPSVGAADLEFGNYPNPIVDVHTTTFAVKGAAAYLVEALKVQIFDLAGRLVYEAEEAGASLDWHTDSDYGEYLANGVYLYKLYALFNGEWVVSEVKKLAILR